MRETIYTIPINEAFEQESECPLCSIERRLEREAVEYELGPAMMEPDHRELTNEKGYCNKHFGMLFQSPNKLPLALVLDTHLEEVRKKVSEMKPVKKSLFGKSEKPSLKPVLSSCMICEKIEKTMDRYCRILPDMWKKDADFCTKFDKSKGFCLPHFEKLYAVSDDRDFIEALLKKEEEELEKLQNDIHKFTLKFDYRYRDTEWGTAKDAPIRAVEKIGGFIEYDDEKK